MIVLEHVSKHFESRTRVTADSIVRHPATSAHWRTTVNGTIIGGRVHDFFGQYRRNSHVLAMLRYSY